MGRKDGIADIDDFSDGNTFQAMGAHPPLGAAVGASFTKRKPMWRALEQSKLDNAT